MLYNFARSILKPIFTLMYNIRVEGKENIPIEGAHIVCSNHVSLIDPILIAISYPYRINSMAKAEVFRNKFFNFILRNVGAFPVKRGEADMNSIKTALKILKDNKVLGIFPEGTRNKKGENKAEPGIALFAIKSKVPVIPIAIISDFKLLKRTIIRIGKPMNFDEYYDKKLVNEDYSKISHSIMSIIRGLIKGDENENNIR